MNISYERNESGFDVKFPFELKESFKDIFKSAKWNSTNHCWEIGVRSEKKLLQWISEVKQIAIDIENCKINSDSYDLTKAEIVKINQATNKINAELIRTLANIDVINAQKELINVKMEFANLNQSLEDAKKELITAESELQRKISQNKTILNSVINVNNVLEKQSIMDSEVRKVGRHHKSNYETAQQVIIDAKVSLGKLGFSSTGLDQLTYMNFNRYDRDKPKSVTIEQILNIKKIEE